MGGPCFEQEGEHPSAEDRELKQLDNFWESSFELNGEAWPTAEHFYQASKFPNNPTLREEIRTAAECKGPGGCYQLGQSNGYRRDWDAIKVDVMYEANLAKYSQNPAVLKVLLSTGNNTIRAQGSPDSWGTWNGILLERIREELRGEAERDESVLASRKTLMDARRSMFSEDGAQLSLKGNRTVLALTRQAAKRRRWVPQGATYTMSGEDLEAAWINGVWSVDPIKPEVNGCPHLMTDAGGHLYLGRKWQHSNGKWVLDEQLDPTEEGGLLVLPPVGIDAASTPEITTLPIGTQKWSMYQDGKIVEVELTLTYIPSVHSEHLVTAVEADNQRPPATAVVFQAEDAQGQGAFVQRLK